MIISFLISFFGLAFAFRTMEICEEMRLISKKEIPIFKHLTFFSSLLCLLLMERHGFLFWISILVCNTFFVTIILYRVIERRIRFKEKFLSNLNVIILKMKSGKSFRNALLELIDSCERHESLLFSELYNGVVFLHQIERLEKNRFLKTVLFEFQAVDMQPHMALRRLTSLRDKIRLEENFRRKSGQVSAQARAQALVLSVIYFALMVFVLRTFGWDQNRNLILTSVFLFGTGLIGVFRIGRGIKWKV